MFGLAGLFGGGMSLSNSSSASSAQGDFEGGTAGFGAVSIGGQATGRARSGDASASGGGTGGGSIPSWIWIAAAAIAGIFILGKVVR